MLEKNSLGRLSEGEGRLLSVLRRSDREVERSLSMSKRGELVSNPSKAFSSEFS